MTTLVVPAASAQDEDTIFPTNIDIGIDESARPLVPCKWCYLWEIRQNDRRFVGLVVKCLENGLHYFARGLVIKAVSSLFLLRAHEEAQPTA
jgi:hypothetical protein